MRKNRVRSVVLFAAIALLAITFCMALVACNAKEVRRIRPLSSEEFVFEEGDGGCVLVSCNGSNSDVTIPAQYKGKDVVGIGDRAFYGLAGVTSVKIPDSVTSIGVDAFYGCTALGEIELPEAVTNIGIDAFGNCTSLKSVKMGSKVQVIGQAAFGYCKALEEITIPEDVKQIGKSAFYNCTALSTVNWNATDCTEVGKDDSYTFAGCLNIKTVNIGDKVQAVPALAFYHCNNITRVNCLGDLRSWCEIDFKDSFANPLYEASGRAKLYVKNGASFSEVTGSVNIPEGTERIGNAAFYQLDRISLITIPQSVTSIGERAFNNLDELISVNWNAENCETAGSFSYHSDRTVFNGCTNLDTVNFGDNVRHIPAYTLRNVKSLKYLYLGESVTSVGENAFFACNNVVRVNVASLKSWCGISFARDNTHPLIQANGNARLYHNGKEVTTVNDLDGITYIPKYAFFNCTGITSATIPESVQRIESLAFSSCTGLKIVDWNATECSYAGSDKDGLAFANCGQLATVNIGDSVTVIPSVAFKNCTGLGQIILPANVKTVGTEAFAGCRTLHNVTIQGVENVGDRAFADCAGISNIFMEDVTNLGNGAFSGCTSLSSLSISKVENIGNSAFAGCTKMISVTIGEGIVNIGGGAFAGCTALKTVVWEAKDCKTTGSADSPIFGGCSELNGISIFSAPNIPDYAFSKCLGIESVTIPESVQSIGKGAFAGCANLENLYASSSVIRAGSSAIDGTKYYNNLPDGCVYLGRALYKFKGGAPKDETTIDIKYDTTQICDFAFAGCTWLQTIDFPSGLKEISDSAFQGCTSLENVSIGGEVENIGKEAFQGCTKLESVTIGKGVRNIDNLAFAGCKNLKEIEVSSANEVYQSYYGVVYLKADKTIYYVPEDAQGINGTIYMLEGCTIIGERAFAGRKGLKGIVITSDMERIDSTAFNDCTNLVVVALYTGVTKLCAGAFMYCTSIKAVIISYTVESIGDEAFAGCTGLETIFYGLGESQWENITKGKDWDKSAKYEMHYWFEIPI